MFFGAIIWRFANTTVSEGESGKMGRIPYSSPSTGRSVEDHIRTVRWNSDSSFKTGVGKGPYLEVVSDRPAGRGILTWTRVLGTSSNLSNWPLTSTGGLQFSHPASRNCTPHRRALPRCWVCHWQIQNSFGRCQYFESMWVEEQVTWMQRKTFDIVILSASREWSIISDY